MVSKTHTRPCEYVITGKRPLRCGDKHVHFTALWPRASPSATDWVGLVARARPSHNVPYPTNRVRLAHKPWPAPTHRPVRRPRQGGPRVYEPTPNTLGTRCSRACILSRTDPDASLNRFRTRVPGWRRTRTDIIGCRTLYFGFGSLFADVVQRRSCPSSVLLCNDRRRILQVFHAVANHRLLLRIVVVIFLALRRHRYRSTRF